MRLHVDESIRVSEGRCRSGCIKNESTKIALSVLILKAHQTSNQLKLDLGGPLTAGSMMLPMMHHKRSRMILITTTEAPLSQQTCNARGLPKFFKLSGQKHFRQVRM
jgi:hypothetical protein